MDNETNKSKSMEYTLGIIIVVGLIVLFLFGFPMTTAHPRPTPSRVAISNAKQIGLALFVFESDYGAYPNASTESIITSKFPSHGYDLTKKYSNSAFLQLVASGITPSEEIYYAEIKDSRSPDGFMISSDALKKGEVGFSYICDLTAKDDPATPLVLTPLIAGTTKFDPKPFDGKALILHIDQSVSTHIIAKDGHVYDKGIDILSPKHPIWKGKAPDLRHPE